MYCSKTNYIGALSLKVDVMPERGAFRNVETCIALPHPSARVRRSMSHRQLTAGRTEGGTLANEDGRKLRSPQPASTRLSSAILFYFVGCLAPSPRKLLLSPTSIYLFTRGYSTAGLKQVGPWTLFLQPP